MRTIYGPSPAVCFTEMPIGAFLEAGAARWARGENMSPYGLVFRKIALFNRGANPVLYGLDDRNAQLPAKSAGPRLISETLLPLQEQYRYVTYNPSASIAIDWTHEREWRFPYRDSIEHIENHVKEYGSGPAIEEYRGLALVGADLNGMGVIVRFDTRGKRGCVRHPDPRRPWCYRRSAVPLHPCAEINCLGPWSYEIQKRSRMRLRVPR